MQSRYSGPFSRSVRSAHLQACIPLHPGEAAQSDRMSATQRRSPSTCRPGFSRPSGSNASFICFINSYSASFKPKRRDFTAYFQRRSLDHGRGTFREVEESRPRTKSGARRYHSAHGQATPPGGTPHYFMHRRRKSDDAHHDRTKRVVTISQALPCAASSGAFENRPVRSLRKIFQLPVDGARVLAKSQPYFVFRSQPFAGHRLQCALAHCRDTPRPPPVHPRISLSLWQSSQISREVSG